MSESLKSEKQTESSAAAEIADKHLDPLLIGTTVEVRWDEEKGDWIVMSGQTLRSHPDLRMDRCKTLYLRDAVFIMDRHLQKKAQETKSFTVHAWIRGKIISAESYYLIREKPGEVKYSPKTMTDFICNGRRIEYADFAAFRGRRVFIKRESRKRSGSKENNALAIVPAVKLPGASHGTA